MTYLETEVDTDYSRSGGGSDWIAKMTPLILMDVISLSLLFGGVINNKSKRRKKISTRNTRKEDHKQPFFVKPFQPKTKYKPIPKQTPPVQPFIHISPPFSEDTPMIVVSPPKHDKSEVLSYPKITTNTVTEGIQSTIRGNRKFKLKKPKDGKQLIDR